eukprot:CAMPEP_0174373448 /NCGR_PEP_ID=MMETSP0811_2-20130205/107116_1 /TAXON_ID=73025 ORGANISM="Eutreptiella gymnastica-like, Strain CCMP1594" /NCGR_SAMPLE_ID=MMETSP0811_2 /ASSEMBLY_ACC=CAM_ASM_000667 /LENGTH=73 /DNA_ID=CAMNT_0015521765 /DNA_START=58 /DNA_END=275 /DNA_ORIENTATION=-
MKDELGRGMSYREALQLVQWEPTVGMTKREKLLEAEDGLPIVDAPAAILAITNQGSSAEHRLQKVEGRRVRET